jgi:transposase
VERLCAQRLVRTPYLLLLAIPGINVVCAADLAGELGPIEHYANANRITGRAGLMPSRYQSDLVDREGALSHSGHRRLRVALLQCADNLVAHNHHFQVLAVNWRQRDKDPRWMRVKVAKSFSRIGYAMVAGRTLFPHRCCQPRHYIIDKLLEFHRLHDTPMSAVLPDLELATAQLPRSSYADEARPLHERLQNLNGRRRGPRPLSEILPIVLARLGVAPVQSNAAEDRDPG